MVLVLLGSCDISRLVVVVVQVKEQTLREREQAELRLQEAHQAEQNALAHLRSLRKDCRYNLSLSALPLAHC